MNILDEALEFAREAHFGQIRKYTGEPYINHPIEVAELVASVDGSDEMIAAALLHDAVEDTETTSADIRRNFGIQICYLVDCLTDISRPGAGNRETRKAIDRLYTAEASPEAKTIKLADLINNSESILERDPNFAKVYMNEKRLLLEVLTEGNSILYRQAEKIVNNYYR